MKQKKENITITHPHLLKEWHPTKNGALDPSTLTFGVAKRIWWQCEKGHEWEARLNNRTRRGVGCPICAKQQVTQGVNDLATTHPQLAKQWHPTKNGDLSPQDVSKGSGKRVWWQCEKGHEWEASVGHRSQGNGCPTCNNLEKTIVPYERSLAALHPNLINEWHPTKNGELDPCSVGASSAQMIWWQCEKGHEWEAQLTNRRKGRGCPYCANRKIIPGENDLATIHPHLAKEWHPTKNLPLTPQMVSKASSKKVWWQCEKGHEWEAVISNRANGTKCPICSKQNRKR